MPLISGRDVRCPHAWQVLIWSGVVYSKVPPISGTWAVGPGFHGLRRHPQPWISGVSWIRRVMPKVMVMFLFYSISFFARAPLPD